MSNSGHSMSAKRNRKLFLLRRHHQRLIGHQYFFCTDLFRRFAGRYKKYRSISAMCVSDTFRCQITVYARLFYQYSTRLLISIQSPTRLLIPQIYHYLHAYKFRECFLTCTFINSQSLSSTTILDFNKGGLGYKRFCKIGNECNASQERPQLYFYVGNGKDIYLYAKEMRFFCSSAAFHVMVINLRLSEPLPFLKLC